MTAAERQWKNERAGGNYGAGTKEIQERNYIAQKELERKRKEMFEDALSDYRAGKVDEALQVFEEVKALEPAKYMGDGFERVSRIAVVTMYNIACCYSSLKVADAGLESLEECMKSGFEDYGKVRLRLQCSELLCKVLNCSICTAECTGVVSSWELHSTCAWGTPGLVYARTCVSRQMSVHADPIRQEPGIPSPG